MSEEIDMKTWIADLVDEELLSQQHLNETNDDFIQRVCDLCLQEIEASNGYAPSGFGHEVVEEIEIEVTEIFRIRTYGHYNLQAYRKAQLKKRTG